MKKSAIYLGASAAILAIAGAFTTKGSTKVKAIVGWTKLCGHSVQTTCANLANHAICKTSGGTTLYTKVGTACVNKLKTGAE